MELNLMNLRLSTRSLTLRLSRKLNKICSPYQTRNCTHSRHNKPHKSNTCSHKRISSLPKRCNRLSRQNRFRHRNRNNCNNHRLRARLVLRNTMTL